MQLPENINELKALKARVDHKLAGMELFETIDQLDAMRAKVANKILEMQLKIIDNKALMQEVKKGIFEIFGIQYTLIFSKSRNHEVVAARHAAIYVVKNLTLLSLKKVGEMFNRDHTTVIYACQRIDLAERCEKELWRKTIRLKEYLKKSI